jgi:hypothetical protein
MPRVPPGAFDAGFAGALEPAGGGVVEAGVEFPSHAMSATDRIQRHAATMTRRW